MGERPAGGSLSLRLQEAPVDETRYIVAARDGDDEARAWLVQRFTPPVFRFALRLLGDEQDARDAAQDTMIKVLRSLDRYDERWRFSTWIFGIARNTCSDEHRRRRRGGEPVDDEVVDTRPGPHELSSRAERARLLHAALQDVPPLYRDVLILYHFEHLKYEEIAEALDLPMGTVMNRIFRARKKLREALAARGGVEPVGLDERHGGGP